MLKNFIQNLIKLLGYKIIKSSSIDKSNLDDMIKLIIKKSEPVIFDVGANEGQSIRRYKKIFENPILHSFEPGNDAVNILKEKYKNEKDLFVINSAVGEKDGDLDFYITVDTSHSSFKKLLPNSTWIKKRSKTQNVDKNKYTTEKVSTKIIALDDYVKKNNINNIDVLKIDTQGYEDKVLLGAKNLIMNNKIKLIELELIFAEIYENPLQIYDIEKVLIPNNYKLFCISNAGSLASDYSFQANFIYVSKDIYEDLIPTL